jgi:hypothetical protein
MIRLDHSVEKNYAVADRVAPGVFIPVDYTPNAQAAVKEAFFLDPVETILREATLWQPDLFVLTTQGHRDFFAALRGSTHCPVLAVPETPALK